MNEKGICVLEKYDFEVIRAGRTRGAILCETNKGPLLLKECTMKPARVKVLEMLLNYLSASSINVDCILKNKEGDTISSDEEGNQYIVKKWYIGRECDVSNPDDIYEGAKNLARLHTVMIKPPDDFLETGKPISTQNLYTVYIRHNQEMKRIRNFMRNVGRKTEFELAVLNCYEELYSEALAATEALRNSGYDMLFSKAVKDNTFIHGNYNYHNILFGVFEMATTNFDHASINIQLQDLYTYLRKVMEKNNWSVEIGDKILNDYSAIKPISKDEMNVMKIMLMYPEKFWKIMNNYFNKNKAWVSSKSMDKLNNVCCQNEKKAYFLEKLF